MGVYKEGKNWKVQVYYKDWQGNRKRKQKRGFRTKGEAREWERDFLQQQSQGVDIEFGNFLEIYYKDMDVRLRENTMYTKRYIIDLKIKPYFEKKILSEITVADVRAWQNELLTYKDKKGKGYSPTYLKTVNCQLTAIFNYAMRYYNLQDNPCRKAGSIGKSKGEPKDFWMQEEFNAFLETVSDKPETKMAFLLLYWTGMRIGELLALTPADFDFTTHTLRINKSYQRLNREDVITTPKTFKSNRFIKMPQFICDEMQDYMEMLYGLKEDERIFTISKSYLHHEMNRGSKVSGVKRIRVHDLRHSHVSLLINMGFTVLAIADRMGHESIDITYRYAHLFPSEQTQMAEQLDIERMEKLNGEKSGQ
jgi:integrase